MASFLLVYNKGRLDCFHCTCLFSCSTWYLSKIKTLLVLLLLMGNENHGESNQSQKLSKPTCAHGLEVNIKLKETICSVNETRSATTLSFETYLLHQG